MQFLVAITDFISDFNLLTIIHLYLSNVPYIYRP